MSDNGPDVGLIQAKLRLDIQTQAQKIAQFEFELLQHEVSKRRTIDNMNACKRALSECEEKLTVSVDAHGEINFNVSDYT